MSNLTKTFQESRRFRRHSTSTLTSQRAALPKEIAENDITTSDMLKFFFMAAAAVIGMFSVFFTGYVLMYILLP